MTRLTLSEVKEDFGKFVSKKEIPTCIGESNLRNTFIDATIMTVGVINREELVKNLFDPGACKISEIDVYSGKGYRLDLLEWLVRRGMEKNVVFTKDFLKGLRTFILRFRSKPGSPESISSLFFLNLVRILYGGNESTNRDALKPRKPFLEIFNENDREIIKEGIQYFFSYIDEKQNLSECYKGDFLNVPVEFKDMYPNFPIEIVQRAVVVEEEPARINPNDFLGIMHLKDSIKKDKGSLQRKKEDIKCLLDCVAAEQKQHDELEARQREKEVTLLHNVKSIEIINIVKTRYKAFDKLISYPQFVDLVKSELDGYIIGVMKKATNMMPLQATGGEPGAAGASGVGEIVRITPSMRPVPAMGAEPAAAEAIGVKEIVSILDVEKAGSSKLNKSDGRIQGPSLKDGEVNKTRKRAATPMKEAEDNMKLKFHKQLSNSEKVPKKGSRNVKKAKINNDAADTSVNSVKGETCYVEEIGGPCVRKRTTPVISYRQHNLGKSGAGAVAGTVGQREMPLACPAEPALKKRGSNDRMAGRKNPVFNERKVPENPNLVPTPPPTPSAIIGVFEKSGGKSKVRNVKPQDGKEMLNAVEAAAVETAKEKIRVLFGTGKDDASDDDVVFLKELSDVSDESLDERESEDDEVSESEEDEEQDEVAGKEVPVQKLDEGPEIHRQAQEEDDHDDDDSDSSDVSPVRTPGRGDISPRHQAKVDQRFEEYLRKQEQAAVRSIMEAE